MDLIVKKVSSLPATYTANTLYFIEGATSSEVMLYITNNDGSVIRHINTTADILAIVAATPPGIGVTVAECTW